MQKLSDCVPFFTHSPPPISTHFLNFSFLLEHFHTFSMMYMQHFPISPHFPPFSPIFPWPAGYSDTPNMDTS